MLYNQQYRIIFILSALYISVLLHHLLTESSCTPVSQTQEVVVAVVICQLLWCNLAKQGCKPQVSTTNMADQFFILELSPLEYTGIE